MILENNLKYLSENIRKKLQTTRAVPLDFKTSKDGFAVPVYNNIALHSTYYPMKESGKLPPRPEKSQVIAIGFGAGYHLALPAGSVKNLLVIPVDVGILAGVLSHIDLDTVFGDGAVKIICSEEVPEYFDFYSFSEISFIIHPVLERMLGAKVLAAVRDISARINPVMTEMNTRRKFGRLWLDNIIKNTGIILGDSYDPPQIGLKGKTVFIAGAGPSLMQNMDTIKKYRGDLFVASSDSALKVLIKNGIEPDCVFSFDPQVYTLEHFTGIKAKLNLLVDFSSPLKSGHKTGYFYSNHPLSEILSGLGIGLPELDSGTRNIGGAMTDFFKRHFSEYPVITAGIDYAYHDHCSYSRGGSLDEYKLANSDYYRSADYIDAKLYYRDKFISVKNDWASTALLGEYAGALKKFDDVYTLSTSPFTDLKPVENIEEIIGKAKRLKGIELVMKKPHPDKKKIIERFIVAVKDKPQCLDTYLLSIGKRPDEKSINEAVKYFEVRIRSIV